MYLEDVRRDGPGKLADRAAEGINLGLAIDQNTSGYKIFFPKERTIKITNQVRFDESIFSMKEAIKARQPAIIEDPIVTFDDFPPDDGTYSVSYDFHLLDPGFNAVQKNTDAGTYI